MKNNLIFFLMILLSVNLKGTDVLYYHILKYNHIEKENTVKPLKVDSSEVFKPINYFKTNYTSNVTEQIITKKKTNSNYVFFAISIICISLISILVYSMNTTFIHLIRDFFNLNLNEKTEFTPLNSLIIFFIYTLMTSFLISALYKYNFSTSNISSNTIFFTTFIGITIHIISKLFLNRLTKFIFGWEKIENQDLNLWLEFMLVFMAFCLPILFLSSMSNSNYLMAFYTVIIASYIIFYLVYSYKNYLFYDYFIQNKIIYSLFYYLTIEFIPLLLLTKYLVNLS